MVPRFDGLYVIGVVIGLLVALIALAAIGCGLLLARWLMSGSL